MTPPRLLVVADDAALLALMQNALTGAGFVVLPAAGGPAAMLILERDAVDLVVTDLVLPERDGLEVIMATRRKSADLPIVAVSGSTDNAQLYLRIAQKLGANEALTKPFAAEQFVATVTRALARRDR